MRPTASTVSSDACDLAGHGCRRCPKRLTAWLWALYLGCAVPLIVTGFEIPGTRLDNDQNLFHLPVIRQFIQQWPTPDYSDYASATTPGYHTVLAAAGVVFGDSIMTLRLVGALFTLGLLALWGFVLGKRLPWPQALAVAATLPASLYVFPAGVWLLPDNAGWWGVLAILALAWFGDWRKTRTYVVASVVLALLVYVRQSHLWVAGAMVMSAWFGGAEQTKGDNPGTKSIASVVLQRPNVKRFVFAGLATLPAVLLLGWFVWLWGAATPPTFAVQDDPDLGVQGMNPAAPAAVFAVASYVGLAFVGFWGPAACAKLKCNKANLAWIALALVVALSAGLIPETTKDADAHRFGGIWGIANLAVVSGRSLTFTATAVVGALTLAMTMLALPWRQRVVMLTAVAGFLPAMTVNAWALPRYYEPLMLMLFALSAVTLRHKESSDNQPNASAPLSFAWLGPALLALGFAALTVFKLS